jgi:hypothetical protein
MSTVQDRCNHKENIPTSHQYLTYKNSTINCLQNKMFRAYSAAIPNSWCLAPPPPLEKSICFHIVSAFQIAISGPASVMHISKACPGGTPPGQPGGNKGEFGILFLYSAREPRGNYKLCNNRMAGGGEVRDFDVTI